MWVFCKVITPPQTHTPTCMHMLSAHTHIHADAHTRVFEVQRWGCQSSHEVFMQHIKCVCEAVFRGCSVSAEKKKRVGFGKEKGGKVRDADGQTEVGRRRRRRKREEAWNFASVSWQPNSSERLESTLFLPLVSVLSLPFASFHPSFLLSLHWNQKRRWRREAGRVERNSIAIQTAGTDRGAPGERRGWGRGGRKREEGRAGEETEQGNDLGWSRREGQSWRRGQRKGRKKLKKIKAEEEDR